MTTPCPVSRRVFTSVIESLRLHPPTEEDRRLDGILRTTHDLRADARRARDAACARAPRDEDAAAELLRSNRRERAVYALCDAADRAVYADDGDLAECWGDLANAVLRGSDVTAAFCG